VNTTARMLHKSMVNGELTHLFCHRLLVILKTMPLWFQKGIINKDREKK